MRYFPLELRPDSTLVVPIMSPYEDEGHVETYFNDQQIGSNMAKHIFKTAMHPTYNGLVNLMVEFNLLNPSFMKN
jgi:hypothetical protein